MLKLLSKSVASSAFVFLSLLAHQSVSYAMPVKMNLLSPEGVHPETGDSQFRILNPSGQVDLTYFDGGFNLKFSNEKNQIQSVKIHVSFYELAYLLPEKDHELFNFAANVVSSSGSVLLVQNLLQLKDMYFILDNSRKPGLINLDYDLSHASVMSQGRRDLALNMLASIVTNQFQHLRAQQLAEKEAALKAQAAEQSPAAKISAASTLSHLQDVKACSSIY